MIEFNMFGLPYVGADICGFNGNTTEELCLRWQQLGSFYPFSRNHNSKGCPDATNFLCQPQDPAALGELVATATRIALSFRYRFLPYLYSLFYLANTIGTPVINALWMPFSTDNNTIDIDRQFLWGEAMLITPVLQPGAEVVDVYLPYTGDDNDAWYSVRNDSDYGKWYKGGQFLTSHPASNTSLIPVFLRSGWVFPCQQPELTTSLSRQNPLELIITAKTPTDHFITASGVFYWDEGDNLDYQTNSVFSTIEVTTHAISNKTFLSFNNQGNFNISPLQIPSLSQVQIFGYLWQSAPIEFVSDSIVRLDANSTILDNGVLTIKFHPYLLLNSSFAVISWQNTD